MTVVQGGMWRSGMIWQPENFASLIMVLHCADVNQWYGGVLDVWGFLLKQLTWETDGVLIFLGTGSHRVYGTWHLQPVDSGATAVVLLCCFYLLGGVAFLGSPGARTATSATQMPL